MITFLVCLALLIGAYFTYGRYLERIMDVRDNKEVPSKTKYDGVDYLPMPRWKLFLIQLLNIAGLGPIFGALLGAAYGPVAFVWITLGGIFFGAMHDFTSGVISLKNDGLSQSEVVKKYFGGGGQKIMMVISLFLMVMAGTVFVSQPAEIIATSISVPTLDVEAVLTPAGNSFSWFLLIIMAAIFIYYIIATMLPIDKIIGKIYPFFGGLMLFMTCSLLVVIFGSYLKDIPEFTGFVNMKANAQNFPIVPMLFTTIACGAISGFHATQSPLVARCMVNENQSRSIFFGSMISESIIALVWAAIGMAFWGGAEGLNAAIAEFGGNAALMIREITVETLGGVLSVIVLFGAVACAITSGDTAFRSARLILADFLGVEQKSIRRRLSVCLPLFAISFCIIFFLPFTTIWSYFAWINQLLAAFTLWMITLYLGRNRRNYWIALIPALVMTYVCMSFVFVSPLLLNMENRVLAYALGGVMTLLMAFVAWKRMKTSEQQK